MFNITNKQCISLAINKNSLTLVAKLNSNKGFVKNKEFKGSVHELIKDGGDAWEWVEQSIKSIKGYKGIPVQMALPDPELHFHIFSLDVLKKKDLDEFLLWTFCDLYHLSEAKYTLTSTYLGMKDGKHFILGVVAELSIIELFCEQFENKQLPLSVIDASAMYRFNFIAPHINAECGTSIHFDADYWSIINWHDDAMLNDIRSKWFAGRLVEETGWGGVHAEFERMSRVFKMQGNDKLSKIFLSGIIPVGYEAWLKANTAFTVVNLMDKNTLGINLKDNSNFTGYCAAEKR
ncbi:hypothetical protein MNBD_GAMMA12-40 [hydrothermal vent metagenome]|uniref:Uncharacterized protein n=1 Tax=hydrothermal vent metagenome TaxID=652676 RepID=A0A3B0YH56_9ZZZZ